MSESDHVQWLKWGSVAGGAQVEISWASREGMGRGYPYPLPSGIQLPIRLWGCEIPAGSRTEPRPKKFSAFYL